MSLFRPRPFSVFFTILGMAARLPRGEHQLNTSATDLSASEPRFAKVNVIEANAVLGHTSVRNLR